MDKQIAAAIVVLTLLGVGAFVYEKKRDHFPVTHLPYASSTSTTPTASTATNTVAIDTSAKTHILQKKIGNKYWVDTKGLVVYSYQELSTNNWQEKTVVVDADLATFKLINDTSDTCSYPPTAKDHEKVFLGNNPIEGADSTSFVAVDADWSKDDNSVYYRGQKVNGAISNTFTTLNNDIINTCAGTSSVYASDEHHVYCEGSVMGDVDSASFTFVGELTKDRKTIYRGCQPYASNLSNDIKQKDLLNEMDIPTLAYVSNSYYKDKNHVYYWTSYSEGETYEFARLPNADPKTFEVINNVFSKDKNRVYFSENILPNLNPKTVQVFKNKFDIVADDKAVYTIILNNHGYIGIEKQEGVDPTSLKD